MQTTTRAPALFISHGAANAADGESEQAIALERLGRSLGRPEAVVVVSSHWNADPPRVTSARQPSTLAAEWPDASDDGEPFVGYPCPGSPALAGRITQLTGAVADPSRGIDHGVWIPLRHMWPHANVPVVQLSLPARVSAEAPVTLGRQLAPLRAEGIVLVGSGRVVQNPRRVQRHGTDPPEWARAFDSWIAERFHALDLPSLMDFRREAPNAYLAAPSGDHLRPLLFVLGAALPGDRADDVFEGFALGTISLRCFALRS